ncbi:MAG: selenocysteine-specific translation elongation factor [Planctomyces sp.]|nr:selenocysteine-specific translation elongation factor [Planctomyces sp.]
MTMAPPEEGAGFESRDPDSNCHSVDSGSSAKFSGGHYSVIGVTGHIDHGKTSLVRALSGIDTDTHPEEKRRGITIDLGFASFREGDWQFALIDAPGHQKYIGNLLAGVSTVDLGLLVVACDQGVQEQTLEHGFILRMLGVQRIVVALSRSDLVDEDQIADRQAEVELFLEELGYPRISVVAVSSVTGAGLNALRLELCSLAIQVSAKRQGKLFRMPVDRILSMPGRGCVLAGTVWTGTIQAGDSLELAASRKLVRVRDIQVHGAGVQSSSSGYRTALNVVGDTGDSLHRGDELLTPNVFPQVRCIVAELTTRAGHSELRCPIQLQIHLAAQSCGARVRGVPYLTSNRSVVVVVETDLPVVATWEQRFLLRLPYPIGTFAGGRTLAVFENSRQKSRELLALGKRLQQSGILERLIAWVDFSGVLAVTAEWAELQLGIYDDAELRNLVDESIASGACVSAGDGNELLSNTEVDRVGERLRSLFRVQTAETVGSWRFEDSVVSELSGEHSAKIIRCALNRLVDGGQLIRLNQMVAPAAGAEQMSAKQRMKLESILALYENSRTPPTLSEASAALQISEDAAMSLCRFAIQSGILVDVGGGFYFWSTVYRDLRQELQATFSVRPELTVAEIRDVWSITRKHAIPLLEHFDRIRFTVRRESLRRLGTVRP